MGTQLVGRRALPARQVANWGADPERLLTDRLERVANILAGVAEWFAGVSMPALPPRREPFFSPARRQPDAVASGGAHTTLRSA